MLEDGLEFVGIGEGRRRRMATWNKGEEWKGREVESLFLARLCFVYCLKKGGRPSVFFLSLSVVVYMASTVSTVFCHVATAAGKGREGNSHTHLCSKQSRKVAQKKNTPPPPFLFLSISFMRTQFGWSVGEGLECGLEGIGIDWINEME